MKKSFKSLDGSDRLKVVEAVDVPRPVDGELFPDGLSKPRKTFGKRIRETIVQQPKRFFVTCVVGGLAGSLGSSYGIRTYENYEYKKHFGLFPSDMQLFCNELLGKEGVPIRETSFYRKSDIPGVESGLEKNVIRGARFTIPDENGDTIEVEAECERDLYDISFVDGKHFVPRGYYGWCSYGHFFCFSNEDKEGFVSFKIQEKSLKDPDKKAVLEEKPPSSQDTLSADENLNVEAFKGGVTASERKISRDGEHERASAEELQALQQRYHYLVQQATKKLHDNGVEIYAPETPPSPWSEIWYRDPAKQ